MRTDIEEPKKPRLLFLDNIKLLFAILVIFQHARVTYQGSGWWYYIETIQPPIIELDLLSTIIFQIIISIGGLFQTSLLGLFFLMGGFLTPRSFERKGVYRFWRERLLRLGVPLLIYILIINPILAYILASLEINPWNTYVSLQGTFLDYYANQFESVSQLLDFLFSTGPMWFLFVLLLFTAGYTLWCQIKKVDQVQKRIPKEISIPSNISLFLLAILLGTGTFLVRIEFPVDSFPFSIPVGSIIQYILMFSIGIVAMQNEWFHKMTRNHIKVWASIIAITFISFFVYYVLFVGFDADPQEFLGGSPPTLNAFLFAVVDNIISMGMIFVLIPLFYFRFNEQGLLLQNLSASSFPMYLIHAPILIAVSLIFAPINLFPIIKFALVFPLTVILCFLASHYFLLKVL